LPLRAAPGFSFPGTGKIDLGLSAVERASTRSGVGVYFIVKVSDAAIADLHRRENVLHALQCARGNGQLLRRLLPGEKTANRT
jgi:hypothetical protein